MKQRSDILVLENSNRDYERLCDRLTQDGVSHNRIWARDRESFLDRLHDSIPGVIVANMEVPQWDLESTLRNAGDHQPETPLILLAPPDAEDLALAGLEAGASDYVLKPELNRLGPSVRRALKESSGREKQRWLGAKLEVAEDVYRSLVANIPYQIFRKDPDGRFTFVNEHFARLLGRPASAIIGATDFDIFPPELARKYRDDDLEVMETQTPRETTEQNRSAGKLRIVKVVKVPILDGERHSVGVQGMFWDITEAAEAEDQIARQILTLDRVSDAIIECTGQGEVTYWNQAAERLYHRRADEVLGSNFLETLGLEKAAFLPVWQQLLKRGEWRGEWPQLTRGGAPLTVESHATLIRNRDGEVESLLLVNREVSERKGLERQLHSLSLTQNLNVLSKGVAHDLNGVLAPVQAAVQHLRFLVQPDHFDQDHVERTLAVIEQSIETGTSLLGKLAPGSTKSTESAIDIGRLVSEFVDHVHQLLPGTIIIQQEIEPDLPPVAGDAIGLRQVLMNLAMNARDAMPHGGLLRFSVQTAKVDESFFADGQRGSPGNYVVIAATDSGTGIEPQIRDQIFRPYFTTKPAGQGTGLGLTTVSRVVYETGGFVRVYSQAGEGASFQVYLPAGVETPTEPGNDAPPAHTTVLVVDDDAAIVRLTTAVLQHHGINSIAAQDGREALEKMSAQGDAVDLIITDMRMPNLNGLEFIRELRARDFDTPIIMMTGVDVRNEFAELSQHLGVKQFLAKPFSQQELLAEVQLALLTPADA